VFQKDAGMLPRLFAALALVGAIPRTQATVAEVTASGFLVKHQLTISALPDKVYTALSHDVGRWWNPDHTYSGDAKNLSIDARPGGCFCERLPSGGGVEHMRVIYIDPNKVLRLSGALGPLQGSGLAGSMTWKLTPSGKTTQVELTYSVGGYLQGGFEKMAPAVDAMLGEQAQRLEAFVEGAAARR
jgi:uncharacterized protein YndB with AHSA1/START domain